MVALSRSTNHTDISEHTRENDSQHTKDPKMIVLDARNRNDLTISSCSCAGTLTEPSNHMAIIRTPCDHHCQHPTTPPLIRENRLRILPALSDEIRVGVSPSRQLDVNSRGRKRQRGYLSYRLDLPPIFPDLSQCNVPEENLFRKHFPIHSPIKGLSHSLTMEFRMSPSPLAKSNANSSHDVQDKFPSSSETSSLGSFVKVRKLQNAFPVLNDDSNEESVRIEKSNNCVATFRALNMRRQTCEQKARFEAFSMFTTK